jgi:hypothetical protein
LSLCGYRVKKVLVLKLSRRCFSPGAFRMNALELGVESKVLFPLRNRKRVVKLKQHLLPKNEKRSTALPQARR